MLGRAAAGSSVPDTPPALFTGALTLPRPWVGSAFLLGVALLFSDGLSSFPGVVLAPSFLPCPPRPAGRVVITGCRVCGGPVHGLCTRRLGCCPSAPRSALRGLLPLQDSTAGLWETPRGAAAAPVGRLPSQRRSRCSGLLAAVWRRPCSSPLAWTGGVWVGADSESVQLGAARVHPRSVRCHHLCLSPDSATSSGRAVPAAEVGALGFVAFWCLKCPRRALCSLAAPHPTPTPRRRLRLPTRFCV